MHQSCLPQLPPAVATPSPRLPCQFSSCSLFLWFLGARGSFLYRGAACPLTDVERLSLARDTALGLSTVAVIPLGLGKFSLLTVFGCCYFQSCPLRITQLCEIGAGSCLFYFWGTRFVHLSSFPLFFFSFFVFLRVGFSFIIIHTGAASSPLPTICTIFVQGVGADFLKSFFFFVLGQAQGSSSLWC